MVHGGGGRSLILSILNMLSVLKCISAIKLSVECESMTFFKVTNCLTVRVGVTEVNTQGFSHSSD